MRRCLPLLSALALAVVVVVTACSGGADDLGPSATVGTAPTTTTTAPRPVDPAVIPSDPTQIDEPYVQAVVDALFAVDAEATKIFVETRNPIDERAIDYLEAIYVPEELDRQLNIWFKTLATGSDTLRPGAVRNDVQRVMDVAKDCVFIEVSRDYSETTKRDVAPGTIYLGLTPKQGTHDPNGMNPTGWMLFMDGLNPDGSVPENPCAGR